ADPTSPPREPPPAPAKPLVSSTPQPPSATRNRSFSVVGASQVKLRQTYAAGRPSTSGRPASNGNSSLSGVPTATTAPGAVPSNAVRCSATVPGSSGAGPTTATSRGPSSSASATASPHPMNRGTRGPS